MNKTYNKLRKKVYEIIYTDSIPIEPWFEIGYISDEETSMSYEKIIHCLWFDSFLIPPWPIHKMQIKENLWPDLSLQDILRALRKRTNDDTSVSCYQAWWHITVFGKKTEFLMGIDMSKKPKDREEETLQKILELLS